jgi:hypothetical protein
VALLHTDGVSESWDRGSTRAWRRLREEILVRDRGVCRAHVDGWCARRPGVHVCEGRAVLAGGHAHHTLGRAATGDDPRFIVASCATCNAHIGDPTELRDPVNRPVTCWSITQSDEGEIGK